MSAEFQIGAAGLGIGAFSGVLDVLSSCTKLYGMWRSLRGLDGQLSILRAKLLLQQALLEQWQRDWLLDTPNTSGHRSSRKQSWVKQHEVAITETLSAVRTLLQELEPLREASEKKTSNQSVIAASANRLVWANSKAADSEKALEHLDSLLAGIYRLLPPQTPNTHTSQVLLSMDDIASESGDFESLVSALSTGSKRGSTTSSTSSTLEKTFGLRNLGDKLKEDLDKRVDQFTHRSSTANLAIKASRVQIRTHDQSTAGFRSFGNLDGMEDVLVEWKKYDSTWQGKKGIELTGRIFNIAQLLNSETKPDELLTLKCLGFFDDPERSAYGFVFQIPPGSPYPSLKTDGKYPMASLKSLLDTPSPNTLPTLEDRYHAAYSLALSLSILHGVSWLHKSIRSQNVLFVVAPDGRPIWSRPYLVGFEFSRPDAIDESSEKPEQSARFNVYRHPLAQGTPGEGYRKAFDVYSLGVLLTEIAMWRPAWKLYKDGVDPAAFRQLLVQKAADWTCHLMGVDYHNATMHCLGGDQPRDQSRLAQNFYVNVVEVLGRLVAGSS
ncbi:hypothetical protein CSOJ01_14417 [Colletotrichum sojae]|uniref:Protein kinase domain-containing protein n=1 Tax=Colletotrichum sojae TaxID=2175907 RepID=A0A8H6IQM8_9PEZI|nr:hypothetical protein CSOJ01_14417 [Colletotrichum sojae]